ncbi:MAG: amidohydrolase 2 [Acidimicrobiales bacterium]|nr:amidohydrolase 2 [Acidimicrobiales bacterium]
MSSISIPVIDADSHLTETPDLFTSRLPQKWQAEAPKVVLDDQGIERWRIAGRWLSPVGAASPAGEVFGPSHWDEVDPATYDPSSRATWMDEHGIQMQVLYPNIVALEGHAIMSLSDPELKLACVRASNDHMTDFCNAVPNRFVPLACVPFWDIEESIKEMERCAGLGHKGVVWAATLTKHGLPGTTSKYWDRFYGAAQDLGMSINFHVGVGYTEEEIGIASQRIAKVDPLDQATDQVRRTAMSFMANGRTVAGIIMSGLCDRFPDLDFVSVESGFGYFPYLIEALDWQWRNTGDYHNIFKERLLPSEYFRRQVYTMFWFEETTLPLLQVFPDNVMFETDFPHPTSLTPGPGTVSPNPADLVQRHIGTYGAELMKKVLWDNAARVYHVDAV